MGLGEPNSFQQILVHFEGQISTKIKVHQNRCEIRLILISMKLGQHVAAPLQPPYKSHQKPVTEEALL